MAIARIFISLFLVFALGLLPGCAGNKTQKSRAHKNKARVETSIDLPPAILEEKLSKIGISSEPGEILAHNEKALETPSSPIEVASEEVGTSETEEKKKNSQETFIPAEAEEPSIEFHFENADLEMLINQISELFDVTFVADDSITPMLQNAKSIRGNKISFKTQSPLTKREAWNLFLTFLDISGFTVISEASPRIKRIVTLDAAKRSPLPAYIGVPAAALPNSDEIVRFVYFVENADLKTIAPVVDALRSPTAQLTLLQDMKGFLLTDKSYNIKSLMNIIKELDRITMPQAMSVLKLKRADANQVAELYKTLSQTDTASITQQRYFPGRKALGSTYFPDNVSLFAEPRTNSLILLGPQDAIKRIEDFITQSVDVELSQPYSPLHVLPLRYANANTVAKIMNDVTQFGINTEAGKNGGVRGGDKYMKAITFTAEPETNRLIIKGDYEDFLKAKEVISKLDAPQPQVAIEVLLLSVSLNENKQLGVVMRSRVPGTEGLLGSNTKFQTTGLFGNRSVVENINGNGVNRLLGNLLNLVSNGIAAGNTIISLGDSLNVWAIAQALQTESNVQVLSNPFLIATNKTPASVSLGEVRRVTTGTIIGTQDVNTVGDAPAELRVEITPQINSDGFIVLDIKVSLSQFVGEANPDAAVRTTREVKTKTIVTNKEVLALGGLIQTDIENLQTKVPVLGDIPVIGWLFKNKQKIARKSNLLILISSRIIEPEATEALAQFTDDHITDYTDTINEMYQPSERRDPINRWFFANHNLNEKATDEFVYRQHKESLDEVKVRKDVVTPLVKNDPKKPVNPRDLPFKNQPATVVAQPSSRSKKSLASLDKEVRT